MKQNSLAIVPCYNESGSIAAVVQAVLEQGICDVLVVDDGSVDDSVRLAQRAGAQVVSLPCNLGIGGAMQTGFLYAYRNGYQFAIQVDGDGQHPAREIPKLLDVLQQGDADAVIGSRYLERGRLAGRVSSLSRVLGGTILSGWIRLLSGNTISDPTSGFRAVNRNVLQVFSEVYPTDFPEPVSLITLVRRSFRVREVAVEMDVRKTGESSIRSLTTAVYMIKVMWRMVLERAFR